MDYQSLTLPQVYHVAEANASEARALFAGLDAHQLNWKPAPDAWSMAQCLEHLIAINRAYYPTFDRILNGEYARTLLHRLPVLPALSGRMMIRVLSPDSGQKYKAPVVARPSTSTIEPSIVERFMTQERETLARMRSLEDKQPAAVIITSPFARFMAYGLLDAFRLIVAHERRHLAQARRVMEMDGFPRRAGSRLVSRDAPPHSNR